MSNTPIVYENLQAVINNVVAPTIMGTTAVVGSLSLLFGPQPQKEEPKKEESKDESENKQPLSLKMC